MNKLDKILQLLERNGYNKIGEGTAKDELNGLPSMLYQKTLYPSMFVCANIQITTKKDDPDYVLCIFSKHVSRDLRTFIYQVRADSYSENEENQVKSSCSI